MNGVINETQYMIGQEIFRSLKLQKEDIEHALCSAGMTKPVWSIRNMDELNAASGETTVCYILHSNKVK